MARPEVVLEASFDGHRWHEVEFAYKPGAVGRAPPFCAPHQPRLDWQLWFAALGEYGRNPWLVHLAVHLLQGTAEVRELVAPRAPVWPLPRSTAGALRCAGENSPRMRITPRSAGRAPSSAPSRLQTAERANRVDVRLD